MKKVIIIGAGGVGRETAMLIEQINQVKPTWNILGFLDDNTEIHGLSINGYKILGDIDVINNFPDTYAICAIASPKIKRSIIKRLIASNVNLASIIHPTITIPKTSTIGQGVIIYSGVTISTNVKIGSYVILSPGCGIGHEAVIEDYNSLLWNVNIGGNVRVNEGCLLGTGSIVVQNINIGKEVTIGAGAVVIKDIPSGCTVVGVPARIVKCFDDLNGQDRGY